MKYLFLVILFPFILLGQNGVYKSYYPNGNVSSAVSYSDGIYDGASYWYYPNGNLKEQKTYSNGKINGWIRSYYESGLLKDEYFAEDGIKNGIEKVYYENGGLASIKNYENGKLVKETKFDFDPNYEAPAELYAAGNKQYEIENKQDEIICDAEICPVPVGGMESVYKHLIYPEHAKKYGLEGTVHLIASIDKKGKVTSIRVIRGIGLGCDEAAMDAVKNTKFLPGQDDKGPVESNVTIKINFTLEDKNEVSLKKPITPTSKEVVEEPDDFKKIGQPAEKKSEDVVDQKEITAKPEKKKEYDDSVELDETAERTVAVDEVQTTDFFECVTNVCARPERGIQAILDNFIIPNRVKENKVRGNVIIEADVDEHGKVLNTTVLQGLPYGCGVAAEVAVLDTKFVPARIDGEPVRSKVKIIVPVKY